MEFKTQTGENKQSEGGGGVAERFGEGGSVGEEEQREGDRSAKTLSPLSNI